MLRTRGWARWGASRTLLALGRSGVLPRNLATVALERSNAFSRLEDADVAVFEGMLGPGGVITDAHDVEPYNTWAGLGEMQMGGMH